MTGSKVPSNNSKKDDFKFYKFGLKTESVSFIVSPKDCVNLESLEMNIAIYHATCCPERAF